VTVGGKVLWDKIRKEGEEVLGEIEEAFSKREIQEEEWAILRAAFAGFRERVQEFQELDEKLGGSPEVPLLQRELIGIIDRVHMALARIQAQVSALTRQGLALLGRAWNWLRGAIAWFLSRAAAALHIENWSIAATGGFPFLLATTVSVTFKPKL